MPSRSNLQLRLFLMSTKSYLKFRTIRDTPQMWMGSLVPRPSPHARKKVRNFFRACGEGLGTRLVDGFWKAPITEHLNYRISYYQLCHTNVIVCCSGLTYPNFGIGDSKIIIHCTNGSVCYVAQCSSKNKPPDDTEA